MGDTATSIPIGRLLRSSTVGFTFGCAVPEPEVPVFGAFVKAPAQQDQSEVIGLIYDILIEDDPFVRQLIATPDLPEAYIQDQRQNRMVPIEVSVLSVGHRNGNGLFHRLPPQPPITLDHIRQCTPVEITTFTERFGYLGLVLNAVDVPTDDLIASALDQAASVRPVEQRRYYLIQVGKELARLLGNDLPRLETLLTSVQVTS